MTWMGPKMPALCQQDFMDRRKALRVTMMDLNGPVECR